MTTPRGRRKSLTGTYTFVSASEETEDSGSRCRIVRPVMSSLDGPVYLIEFEDGHRMNAFDDELRRAQP